MVQLSPHIGKKILCWYDRHKRDLPWREPPKSSRQVHANPYFVWLSEIMLQQTTVAAVKPYFLKFICNWPTLDALAAAEDDAVMAAWAGLGYYARARNLLKCARQLTLENQRVFPNNSKDLQKLPGIGPYTAAAIAAIAFGENVAVVDGNIERIVARLLTLDTPFPQAKSKIRAALVPIVPAARSGDFAQAFMDLGATICKPKQPSCLICPLQSHCQAFSLKIPGAYPKKLPKKQKPTRIGAAFVILNPHGHILLRKRPAKGLLAGMTEVPSTDWSARQDGATNISAAPIAANWSHVGHVRHTFTHFHLELVIYKAILEGSNVAKGLGWWADTKALEGQALPSLMHKIIAHTI